MSEKGNTMHSKEAPPQHNQPDHGGDGTPRVGEFRQIAGSDECVQVCGAKPGNQFVVLYLTGVSVEQKTVDGSEIGGLIARPNTWPL